MLSALDTNVLVRYLTMDDPEQGRRAEALIDGGAEGGARFFVAQVVLCELVWVLTRTFGFARPQIAAALSGILGGAQFIVEDADLARRALQRYAAGSADFADYLIAERARQAGCQEVATFDKALLREEGFTQP